MIICARSKDDLEKAKDKLDQYNVNVITFEQELSDDKSVKEFYSKIKSKVNNVDILVNNVGGSLGTTSLLESEIKDFQKVMDINTWVAISLTKLFVEEMIDRGWGRIINIASIYGREYGGSAPTWLPRLRL